MAERKWANKSRQLEKKSATAKAKGQRATARFFATEARAMKARERSARRGVTSLRQQRRAVDSLARSNAKAAKAGRGGRGAGRGAISGGRGRSGARGSGGGIGGLARMSLAGLGAAALAAPALAGAAIFERAAETDANRAAISKLAKTEGAEAFTKIIGLSKELGLNIDQTAHSFANMLKLQFSEKEGRKWVKLGADLQAIGNEADEIQGIFRAIGQIRSKGRLQAEEMLQLAERGVSQELVWDEAAKLMGFGGGDAGREQVRKAQEGR